MASPLELTVPYGVTARGFHRKNIFSDQMRLLGPASRRVVDVGAHHGQELATYLQMFPDAIVHAIEPTPASLDVLRSAYGHNSRVRIHECALAETEGLATLHMYEASECNSLTPHAPESSLDQALTGAVQHVGVRTTTLDQLCRECGIEDIDLLKLDTQGAEVRVLRGATSLLGERRVRLIALEVSFVPLYESQAELEEVIGLLRQAGYHLYDWYNFSYDDNGQVLFGDAMFLPSYLRAGSSPAMASLPVSGDAAEAHMLRKSNERLRRTVAQLEEKIESYKIRVEQLRKRLRHEPPV